LEHIPIIELTRKGFFIQPTGNKINWTIVEFVRMIKNSLKEIIQIIDTFRNYKKGEGGNLVLIISQTFR
jgi:hypothetical protein